VTWQFGLSSELIVWALVMGVALGRVLRMRP
jgi:hypothetical protein